MRDAIFGRNIRVAWINYCREQEQMGVHDFFSLRHSLDLCCSYRTDVWFAYPDYPGNGDKYTELC